jgi:hypothetical protein
MTNLVHHPERLSVGALEGREREEAADALQRWIVTYESSGHARVASDLRRVLALLLPGGTSAAARGQPDRAS